MRSNGEWHTRISSIVSDVFSFSNKLGVFIMQRVAVKNGNVTYIRNIESLNHIVVQKSTTKNIDEITNKIIVKLIQENVDHFHYNIN